MAGLHRRLVLILALAITLLGVAPAAAAPFRGAFYYPWYPETWVVNRNHVAGTYSLQPDDGFHPIKGFYSSTDTTVIDYHLKMLGRANVDVAISSWWGPGTITNDRFPLLLSRTKLAASPLKWALYHEEEGYSNPTFTKIQGDLAYIWTRFVPHPAYARVNGKPVLFVYSADDTTCAVVDRWRQANQAFGFFLVMKVFPGYGSCPNQPNGTAQHGSWHQYGPASRTSHQPGHSFSVSPGFWRADELKPRLPRDHTIFDDNVREMVASGEFWQLVTTFNEWGEGSAVEPARQWPSPSGNGDYLDVLHDPNVTP